MTRIYLDFLWWIASFGTINLNGQVRYNNPVLIDKEEPSSPRLTILLIIIMLVVYKQQDAPILYIFTDGDQAKVWYLTILLIICQSFKPKYILNIYIQWWSGQNLLPHPLLALQKPGSLTAWEFIDTLFLLGMKLRRSWTQFYHHENGRKMVRTKSFNQGLGHNITMH